MTLLTHAAPLSARYPLWLCDVWGVIHNGVAAFPEPCAALARHRAQGGKVILITNAPRPQDSVARQLASLSVPADCYDLIVSSGDVTRSLIRQSRGQYFFIGSRARDMALFEGLEASEAARPEDASFIVCTGLYDDDSETPDDYEELLGQLHARNLPMICANPDIVVQRGNRLIWCAGALARRYAEIGGHVHLAGKPHAPIYEEAFAAARRLGHEPDTAHTLAIGDGLATDAKGAALASLDMLFIAGGIHAGDVAGGSAERAEFLKRIATEAPGIRLAGMMEELHW